MEPCGGKARTFRAGVPSRKERHVPEDSGGSVRAASWAPQ